jgi:hypothetical protein
MVITFNTRKNAPKEVVFWKKRSHSRAKDLCGGKKNKYFIK